MNTPSLMEPLIRLLTECQAYGLRFQKIDLDDADTLLALGARLESWGVTGEMIGKNASKILKRPEFPTPGDILEACQEDIDRANRCEGSKLYVLPPTPEYPYRREIACLDHDLTQEQAEQRWIESQPPKPKPIEMTPELKARRDELRKAEEQEV